MDVSENRGIPKSSILIGFSIINHPFWGYHYFWKHPYNAISAYLYICVHGGLRTHPPLPGAMVDSTRSLTIQTSTFTNQTPTSWKQLKYGFGSSLKTKETCKTQTISGLYHSILCRPLDGFYRNRIFLQIQLADPFFFPPCFFDPRWQNPWNYVGGDKGPERHVRFTPDENSSGLDKWIDIHHHWHFETFVDTHRHIYLYINLNVNTCKSAYIIYIYLSKWPSPMMPSISIPFEGK